MQMRPHSDEIPDASVSTLVGRTDLPVAGLEKAVLTSLPVSADMALVSACSGSTVDPIDELGVIAFVLGLRPDLAEAADRPGP